MDATDIEPMTTPPVLLQIEDEPDRLSALGVGAWGCIGFGWPVIEGLLTGAEDRYGAFGDRVMG